MTVSSMLMRMTYQGTNIRKWFVENTTVEDWALVMEEYDVFRYLYRIRAGQTKELDMLKKYTQR